MKNLTLIIKASSKKVDASAKRFLRLGLLEPGDVILTRPEHWISRKIAKKTGGEYSHAALVYDGWLWFESRADGIGFTVRLPTDLEVEQGEAASPWLLDVSEYARIDVFRHPLWNRLSQARKVVALGKLEKSLFQLSGRDYAPLDLVASVGRHKLGRVVGTVARILDLLRTGVKLDPGPFCSALIVAVYEQIGIDLFHEPKRSWETSPNDLTEPKLSQLQQVRGIVGPALVSTDGEDLEVLSLVRSALSSNEQGGEIRVTLPLERPRWVRRLREARSGRPPKVDQENRARAERLNMIRDYHERLKELDSRLIQLAAVIVRGKLSPRERARLRVEVERLVEVLMEPAGLGGVAGYDFGTVLKRRAARAELLLKMAELYERTTAVEIQRRATLRKARALLVGLREDGTVPR